MGSSKTLLFCAVIVALCLGILLFSETAHAAGGDKDLAAQEGTQLATKEFDQDRLPGTLEISLAVGSFFVMVAVVKWL